MSSKTVDYEKNIKQSPNGPSLVTELERTEQVMGELQEIIEGSFDGILVTDGEANVLLVNQSYVRNTDIKKEELIGHKRKAFLKLQTEVRSFWMR